jgi:hypothetical protein
MTATRARARDLPERPPICAPPAHPPGAGPARWARQPGLGLAGLLLVVPVALALALGAGSAERSLLVLAPLATYALPVIAMIAFWWEDWPGTIFRAPLLGLVDTALVLVGGVVFTLAGQALVAHVDLVGIFDPRAGPAHAPTFPATMAPGGAIFVAMLQLTLVCEGGPLRRLPRVPAGLAALAVSWVAGVALYEIVVPPGLLSGGQFGALLVSVGALQVVFYVVLRGWPFASIEARGPRLLVANAVVVAGGCLGYLLLRGPGDLPDATITAVAGSVVAAGLAVGMLFEGWLDGIMPPGRARAANGVAVAIGAAALYAGMQALAHTAGWSRVEPEEWTAHATLNAIGAGIILHVAIGRRWPFARGTS